MQDPRAERIKQAFRPNSIGGECKCPEHRLVVRAYLGTALDQLRQGYVETMCPDCRKVFRYTVGDCFTLHKKTPVSVH